MIPTFCEGTVWVTLFGRDFALSGQGGRILLASGPGGFFHWWEAFAERGYKKMTFGWGYDSHKPDYSGVPSGVQMVSVPKQKLKVFLIPIWMIAVGMFGTLVLFAILLGKTRENSLE